MRIKKGPFFILLIVQFLLCSELKCWALTPDQVLVVANKMAWHSTDLARYYMKKRGISEDHLILLKTSTNETCTRLEFEEAIADPIRSFLKEKDPEGKKFQCLVLMYGLPLRVRPPELTREEAKELIKLQVKEEVLREQIRQAEEVKKVKAVTELKKEQSQIKKEIDKVRKLRQGAAVDSELALIREESFPLESWLPNKFFLGFRGKKIPNIPQKVILVSRLDGPSEKIVRRIIDDSLEVEKEGLTGTAYFDARWPEPDDKKEVTGYAFYDRAIHRAARVVEKSKKMTVVLDAQEGLFQPGQAPNAALYSGWYSLGRYVDAFTWAKGAVGYHIASAECTTLKNKDSRIWCKMMLEKGAAATLGPVDEPYVQAFPPPDLFFSLLLDGRFTLAECYALSNPFWSWQMVLIGDPLYRPFKQGKRNYENDQKETWPLR